MKINLITKRNIKLKFEFITFAFYIFILRLKSNLLYAVLLALVGIFTFKSHPAFSEIILGMILTLIIFDTINQHYKEYKYRETTRKIKSDIYSSYYCIYEIFRILTDDSSGEIRDIQNETVPCGIKTLNDLIKSKRTKNTIDLPEKDLYVLRSYVKNMQQNIEEANTLTQMLGADFEVYVIAQYLENFSKKISFNVDDKFDKNNSSSLELLFSGLNDTFIKTLIESYTILLNQFEKNIFLKHIIITLTRNVNMPPCEIPLTKEQAAALNKRLKEKQDI